MKNTVKELYGGTDIIDNYTIIREGESYQSLYGYDYYGVNAANGNPIWRKADGSLVQFDTFGAYDYAEYDPSNPEDVSKPSSLTNDDLRYWVNPCRLGTEDGTTRLLSEIST